MAEKKSIATISVITDSDNGYDHIGDVDGGFSESELKKHIEAHGHEKICQHLAYLSWQVWDILRKVNSEKNKGSCLTAKS